MSDFIAALGLVLVIEGVVYGLFPGAIRDLGRQIENLPDSVLRTCGLCSVAIGVGVVWAIRG